ncbi:MAG TPA: hypothetical protein VFD67_03305 [Gemmatimonadaceae bacterium]|nr:hypothetical protein [Gemmatimonadaceae bacterium]
MTPFRRYRWLPFLLAPAIAVARLDAQVTVSSAANQLFHVNDASTTISPITVTDVGGGNIKQNRDIRLIIPTGFNMTWDVTVLNATITGTAAARCATAVAYSNGNLTVTINVQSTFLAGEFVVISGLKFTNFTATSPLNHLAVDLKNNPGVNGTDPRSIQIDPYYDVAITPATQSLTSLPTNGATRTVSFTLQNIGAVSDSYDLFTSKSPGTAITVVSITGTSITQGASPDSARRAALASAATVAVTVTYKVANVAVGTVDTLTLKGRSVGNPVKTSSALFVVTVMKPVLTLAKAVSPAGSPLPGASITFTSTLTNTGTASASSVAIVDSIPSWVEYKVASSSTALPAGVTAAIEYSSDGGLTWTYTPASGACSATAGFDRCVNRIRWRFLAALSSVAPNNQGTLSFVSRIR